VVKRSGQEGTGERRERRVESQGWTEHVGGARSAGPGLARGGCSLLSWQQPKSTGRELLYKPHHNPTGQLKRPQQTPPRWCEAKKKNKRSWLKHHNPTATMVQNVVQYTQVAKATLIPRTARRTRPHATPSTSGTGRRRPSREK
jgi:hypothetical protein